MKYRAYPTPEQETDLPRVSGCVRLVFNLGLAQREMFGRPGRSIRYEGQRGELKDLKEQADFLRDVPHHCLQEGLVDFQTAFDRFFKGISGYPLPRLKGHNDGFRFPDPKPFKACAIQSRVVVTSNRSNEERGDLEPCGWIGTSDSRRPGVTPALTQSIQ